jgi:hypothetical protein
MSKSDEAKAREHRLAAKLRENLRRRKQAPAADSGSRSPSEERAPADGEPTPPENGRG